MEKIYIYYRMDS